jgi:hypothetical protein
MGRRRASGELERLGAEEKAGPRRVRDKESAQVVAGPPPDVAPQDPETELEELFGEVLDEVALRFVEGDS